MADADSNATDPTEDSPADPPVDSTEASTDASPENTTESETEAAAPSDAESQTESETEADTPTEAKREAAPEETASPLPPSPDTGAKPTLQQLPPYSRSLLKIVMPAAVTLATTKQPVRRIVELAPGSIIQFDKSCDDPLDLEISGHPLASGEVVKIGDKFGLRITSIVSPGERFHAVKGMANR